MDNKKLLTIAIPTYNGSRTIRDMLNILLPQVDKRVEVIVSDNFSTDSTIEIIREYIEQYPFIQYVRNDKNIGADGNFLQCMRMATGKFTMLLSDDDILVENGLSKILSFLEKNQDISLAYLYTISFKDKYHNINECDIFKEWSRKPNEDIITTDKKKFISYVGRQWGFTSSFLWNTDRFKLIQSPEDFYGTFWLQSYIHILCSDKADDKLGIIAGPCIAAGGYGIIPNFDAYEVEVISFKKMLDFASQKAKYDSKQFTKLWLWKVCYLLKRSIIKEKAVGKSMTSIAKVFDRLKFYPYAWIHLFPYLLFPSWLCKIILKIVRFKQNRNFISYVNRPT